MAQDSGGAYPALTKEKFQEIKLRREYQPTSPMGVLIREVERVHPDWLPKVWKVSCFSPWTSAGIPSFSQEFDSYEDALKHVRENGTFDHKIEVPRT